MTPEEVSNEFLIQERDAFKLTAQNIEETLLRAKFVLEDNSRFTKEEILEEIDKVLQK